MKTYFGRPEDHFSVPRTDDKVAAAEYFKRGRDTVLATSSRQPGEPGIPLLFQTVPDPDEGSHRVHLDLRSRTPEEQRELVARAEAAGAERIDIGQGDVPWVVLADPEGNEFCVLRPHRSLVE